MRTQPRGRADAGRAKVRDFAQLIIASEDELAHVRPVASTESLSGHDASLVGLVLVRAGAEVVDGWRPPGSW